MRAWFCALALLAWVTPCHAETPMAPLAPLLGCWRGEFEGAADIHDERCFTPMLGGTYVRDVHSVRPTAYSGETIYAYDPIAAALTYSYFASDGGGIRSAVSQHGNTLVFAPADYVGAQTALVSTCARLGGSMVRTSSWPQPSGRSTAHGKCSCALPIGERSNSRKGTQRKRPGFRRALVGIPTQTEISRW